MGVPVHNLFNGIVRLSIINHPFLGTPILGNFQLILRRNQVAAGFFLWGQLLSDENPANVHRGLCPTCTWTRASFDIKKNSALRLKGGTMGIFNGFRWPGYLWIYDI